MQRILVALARTVLLGGVLFFLLFAPWHRLHPANPELVISTSRAPLWQHRDPASRLDLSELGIEIGGMAVVSGGLFFAASLTKKD